MKTAIQDAIDKISFVRNMCNDENNEMDLVHTLETLKKSFIELLEKEKEQMIDFAMQMHKIDCSKTGTDLLLDEAQAYYKQTYNQNK